MDKESSLLNPLRFVKLEGVEGRPQMAELLNRAFPVPAGGCFFDDFPVWDPARDTSTSRVARMGVLDPEGSLLSMAAVRLATLSAGPSSHLSVAIIGAVATNERARGQGLASKTVASALQWATQQGAALALLWGDEHSLYRKLGFELCGEQILAPLAFLKLPALPTGNDSESILQLGRGWTPGLLECLRERTGGIKLNVDDEGWLAAQKNVEWYWLGPALKPRAYAAIGRGIDMENIVHEWGGEPAALQMILSHLLVERPGSSLLGPRELFEKYDFAGAIPHAQVEYLCLARVLDPVQVFRAHHPEVPFTAESLAPGTWELSFDQAKPTQATDSELAEIFFGPNSIKAGAIPAAHWLPLPLWIWGLDAG